jgi:hypothetical protein
MKAISIDLLGTRRRILYHNAATFLRHDEKLVLSKEVACSHEFRMPRIHEFQDVKGIRVNSRHS